MTLQDITVQYVNAVKPGKKYGSIKTSEGQIFACPSALLNQFGPGEVCKIEYGTWDSGGMHITKKIGGAPKQSPNVPQVRARTSPTDSEQIFTTALLKEYIGAHLLELETTAIVNAVNVIRDAYRFTFGGLEKQRNETDVQDEIPY